MQKRGPNSYETQITITFVNNIEIPATGKVELTTTNSWSYVSGATSCSATGFIDQDTTNTVKCEYVTSLYKVHQITTVPASTSLSITLARLKVPDVSPGNINLLSNLISYDESGFIIERWDTTASNTQVTITDNASSTGVSSNHSWTGTPNNAGQSDVDLLMTFSL